MDKKIIIYSSDECPWCKKLKDFLSNNSIEFVERDVSDEQHAKEMMDKSGQMGIPVTDIGGKIIVGFNKDAIQAELGI